MANRLGLDSEANGTSKTSILSVGDKFIAILPKMQLYKFSEDNGKMGDRFFLVILVELFCGVPAAEIRGPSELWGARYLHMSCRFRFLAQKTCTISPRGAESLRCIVRNDDCA